MFTTVLPSTPPPALISLTAMSMAANSGGPRKLKLPVSGRKVPIFNGAMFGCPLALACTAARGSHCFPGGPAVAGPGAVVVLPPPQPAITTDRAPRRAAARTTVRCAMRVSAEQMPATAAVRCLAMRSSDRSAAAARRARPVGCRDEDVILADERPQTHLRL